MAISYENVIQDRVIDSLHTLLADEFSIPIYFDEHKGNHSFLITPNEDTVLSFMQKGQTRSYAVNISYEIASDGEHTKLSMKRITEIAERIKRLIMNNIAYSPSSVYKWHDARIETIAYARNEGILSANLEFVCTSIETL